MDLSNRGVQRRTITALNRASTEASAGIRGGVIETKIDLEVRDLAADHDRHLTDVYCSGTQTKDLTGSQLSGLAPQPNALSANTQLVTMTHPWT